MALRSSIPATQKQDRATTRLVGQRVVVVGSTTEVLERGPEQRLDGFDNRIRQIATRVRGGSADGGKVQVRSQVWRGRPAFDLCSLGAIWHPDSKKSKAIQLSPTLHIRHVCWAMFLVETLPSFEKRENN